MPADAMTRHGSLQHVHDELHVSEASGCFGECRKVELGLLFSYARSNDVVLEVGGRVRTHTVPLARFIGAAGLLPASEACDGARTRLP